MPLELTPDQRLARHHVGDLGEWLEGQRHPFPDVTRSWENIAKQLYKATDGDVELSGETIRKWHRDWVQPVDAEAGAA